MMNQSYRIVLLLAVLVGAALTQLNQVQANGPKATDVQQKMELFNGKNLDGWYTWNRGLGKNNDQSKTFTVHDGLIHVSGQDMGCITTEKEFSNYRFTVEYKWGDKTWGGRKGKAMDSGVVIHSFGEDGAFGGIWAKSVEANLCEGATGDFWIVGGINDGISGTCVATQRSPGRRVFDPKNGKPTTIVSNGQGNFQNRFAAPDWKDVQGFRGPDDVDKANDWNTMIVVAEGNSMIVYVNGTLVNEITGLKQDCGKIQLQSEGAEIFFRKVTIEPLK